MSRSLTAFLALLNRVVDWFIPADISADREMCKQARMFLISHLFGPFIGNVVPLALYLLDPTPGFEVAVLAISITAFWVFPFVLRSIGHYNALAILSIQNLIFCILWSCYWYGGVTSPTLPWVLTIPLLAFFYLGSAPSLRLIVLGLFAANFATFWALSATGNTGQNDMPVDTMQALGLVSTVAASLYVTMMALFHAKALASQSELEAEMKGHLATAAELRRATEEAERAGAAKADFLAKMSHELRTPLNAVIGYSQILIEDASDEGDVETASDLERIHGAGHHLLKLVNEILDLSKIEAGMMELFNEKIDLIGLMEDIVEGFRGAARKNGDELSLQFNGAIGAIVCDSSKLRQIVSQLLDNATKFTRNGKVNVIVAHRRNATGEWLEVRVVDSGIGISESQLSTLFEKFSVIDDSSSSKYGGTGLGLALSQKLCKLMGGEITVQSTLGAGSCFSIAIPAAPPADAPLHALKEEIGATARRGVDAAARAMGAWGAAAINNADDEFRTTVT